LEAVKEYEIFLGFYWFLDNFQNAEWLILKLTYQLEGGGREATSCDHLCEVGLLAAHGIDGSECSCLAQHRVRFVDISQ